MSEARMPDGALGPRAHARRSETRAVILAGGRGTRLAPLTSVLPKPLMPVGERAILEVVVSQLARYGITDITFSVGYLSHLIRAVFDNGAGQGLDISYVKEETPLGTAAPLRLVEGLEDTFLVMNGDVLTTLDYRHLIEYHRSAGNAITIASHRRTMKIDYGVLHHSIVDGSERLVAFEEKPEIGLAVSMGVYAMEPSILHLIPEGTHFDFPDLVQAALAAGEPVGVYLYDGLWFDIGRHEDYEQAVQAWESIEHVVDARPAASAPHAS